jgi:predicted RNA binding protein YcfA (HicA-like mRNA interferase family)
MRNNPRDWRIEDLKSIAKRCGVPVDHDGTSHVVFRHPAAGRLTVPAARPIKPVYIRLFVAYIDRLEEAP